METDCLSAGNMDSTLPLSSLRLLVPPLRLASAAMWHMTLRGEVKHFGKFEEFVTLVTETIPELMTDKHCSQLSQGLRKRFILELCRSGRATETQTIDAHLDRIRSLCASRNPTGRNVAEASDGDFLELVQTLLQDPAQRQHYFQEVFPVEFGPKYDSTLQTLMWDFLSRLENLLHVPDLTQAASLLSAAPAGVEECLQSASHQQQLKTLLQHHKCFKQFSSDPIPPSAEITSQQAESGSQSGSITVLSSSTLSREVEPECLIDSTDYSELEVELRRSVGFSEGAAVMEGEDKGMESKGGEMDNNGQSSWKEDKDLGLRGGREQERNELGSGNEITHGPRTIEESAVTCDRMEPELLMTLKWLPESEGKINMNGPQRFTHENGRAGWTLGAHACVFACTECRVFHSDESSVHQHIQAAHPHQCKELVWTGGSKVENPGPSSTAHPVNAQAQIPAPSLAPNPASKLNPIPEHDTTLYQNPTLILTLFPTPAHNPTPGPAFNPAPTPGPAFNPAPTPGPACNPAPTPGSQLPDAAKPETSGSRPHCCSICGKSFKSPSDRTRHERTHTGERPFPCGQCGKAFITAWDLTRHQRSHAGKLPFYCKQCGDSFKSSKELTQHRLTHPAKRRYSCRRCGTSFDSLLERSKHRQTHAVRRQHKCPQCEKSYTRPSDMRRHQRSHTGERPYRCALCAKTFRSSTGERKHQQTHTGERPFPCSYCGKRFTRLPILTRHERIHTGERPYLCSHCGKSFLSLGELSKHQKCHTEERPYLCAHCGKGFKREGALMKHRRTHTGERPYRCAHCAKTFTDRSGLNRHQLLHTGERPYCCPQCGKSFLSSGELLKHQRFHTGERPFSCSLCHKSFTQSCYLKRHQRSHSGERPYSCAHCGKSFPCSAQLSRHSRTHPEDLPFSCPECGQSFSLSHLLKTHQLTHAVAQS